MILAVFDHLWQSTLFACAAGLLALALRRHSDTMTPQLAAAARQQSSQSAALVRKQGAFESLAFARVLPNGADMYIATFARGKLMWMIMPLTKDGKVSGMIFRPFPP